MRKIKAGVIGTGFIGPAHVEALRRLGYVDVVAIAGSSPEQARKKAEELNIPEYYGSYKDMLADDDIQVVHNCTPNYLHYQVNRDVILAGKHVVSEKPLAMNRSESADLVALARKHRVVHAVTFNYRHFPMVQQMKAMMNAGELGKVHLVHGGYLQDWLLYDTDYNWRIDPKSGGESRAVADIGSHWCDLAQHVVGKRIVSVFADLATVIPVRKKPTGTGTATFGSGNLPAETEEIEVTTEDFATVLLRFEGRARGIFTVSQVSAGRKNKLFIEVNGSDQSAAWNQEEPERLWIGSRNEANRVMMADPALLSEYAKAFHHYPGGHNEGWPDALKNTMNSIYLYIREGKDPSVEKPPFATFDDGHFSLCIIDSILQSSRLGTWVDVRYDDR
jgi:Predicted dehydrogenases and related proteins